MCHPLDARFEASVYLPLSALVTEWGRALKRGLLSRPATGAVVRAQFEPLRCSLFGDGLRSGAVSHSMSDEVSESRGPCPVMMGTLSGQRH